MSSESMELILLYYHRCRLLSIGGAMLIGVHLLRGLTSAESADLRLVVYLMSALIGYVIFTLAVFNIYPLRYHKGLPSRAS